MNKKLLVFCLAIALVVIGFLLSPIEIKAKRVIALDDSSTDSFYSSVKNSGAINTRLGMAAVSFANKIGSTDNNGNLILSLGEASITLPIESQTTHIVRVTEGQRREEMASSFAKKLGWTEEEKLSFAGATSTCSYRGGEGYRFPGRYLVVAGVTPEEVVDTMEERFNDVYLSLVVASGTPALDPNTVVRVASMIQREAGGKHDMRLISGILWNRMLIGMPLQVDATLQYVKGKEGRWWPAVTSKDKRLDSPFNTYQNDGLPPEPIASPGSSALEAAMHPVDTNCLYYLHDKSRTIHCSSDYKGHLRNIDRYL